MNNPSDFWKGVRRIAADLDQTAHRRDLEEEQPGDRKHLERSQKEIWLISLGDEDRGQKPGFTVNTHPWNAAKLIKQGTHRLATEGEIANWHAEQAERRKAHDQAELERKQAVHTTVSIDPQPLADAIVAGLSAQAEQPAGRRPAAR